MSTTSPLIKPYSETRQPSWLPLFLALVIVAAIIGVTVTQIETRPETLAISITPTLSENPELALHRQFMVQQNASREESYLAVNPELIIARNYSDLTGKLNEDPEFLAANPELKVHRYYVATQK